MNHLNINTLWKYVGPKPGTGEIHKIIFADPIGNEIISISGSHAWLGDLNSFLQNFRWIATG